MCSGKLQTGLLVAGYFIYLLVGAAVFQALERTAEKQEKMAAAQMKEAFLQTFTQLTVAEMEQFMKNLTEAIQNGVYPVGNESQLEESNWDFSNSFFFAGTVVSTIGYGTLHPKTAGGQIFCVFFALFGIPLNIVFLHRVGKMLSLLCKKLGKFLYEKGMRKKKIKFLTLLFFLATGVLVFLCLPSVFFQITEGWSYSEGIYFAFITLSTIGFGDYVVGKEMIGTKAENIFANSIPAEEKQTVVGYLSMRTNLPSPTPFPELLDDEENINLYCSEHCRTWHELPASTPSTQVQNGKRSTRFVVISLSMDMAVSPAGSDLEHSINNITKSSCRCQCHIICITMIRLWGTKLSKQSDRNYFSYYRVLVAIWILFGLAWIALLFNLLTTVLEDTEKIIVKDLQQIGKVSKDNVASQQRRCWPVQFIPEEEPLPLRAEGNAQKMESTADAEHTKNDKNKFSNSKTIAITYEN